MDVLLRQDLHISLSDVNGEETSIVSDFQHYIIIPCFVPPYVAQGDQCKLGFPANNTIPCAILNKFQ